mmetsp:Transcript_26976/g.41358  ORF Transcript_26976/g.41358 Transcript_26976/m.41358 type:complete len:574 (-) Transcript_26976:1370-3091(-)
MMTMTCRYPLLPMVLLLLLTWPKCRILYHLWRCSMRIPLAPSPMMKQTFHYHPRKKSSNGGSKRRQFRKKSKKSLFRMSPLKTISDSDEENEDRQEAKNDKTASSTSTSASAFANGQSERSTASSRHMLGAATPFYGTSDNSESDDPYRLGIEPGNYDKPSEDSIPYSPFGLANQKEEKKGPRPSPFDFQMGDEDSQHNQSQGWPHDQSAIVPVSPRSVQDDLNEQPLKTKNAMVHEQTAKGQFLLNSTKMTVSPHANLKLHLDESTGGMTPDMVKQASKRALQLDLKNERQSSSKSLLAIDRLPSLLKRRGAGGSIDDHKFGSSRRKSSTTSLGLPSVSSSVLHCADPFKIFVLLLQPRAKIFELIQIVYSPMDTTVGDMIDMIPDNATEPALGNQKYVGFARPNGGEEIIDFDQLASGKQGSMYGDDYDNSRTSSCARITRGEILIAIPETYRGSEICTIGKPILSNKKLVMLLQRKDPLKTPTPLSRSRRSSSKSVGGSVCSATSSLASRDDSSTSTYGTANFNASISEGISPPQVSSRRSSRIHHRHRRPYSFRRSSSVKEEDEGHDEH